MKVVGGIEGIAFVHFDERDVVRHKLVQQIVKAYEAFRRPADAQPIASAIRDVPAGLAVVDRRLRVAWRDAARADEPVCASVAAPASAPRGARGAA